MKTFQQFCEQAYNLNEVAATATAQNPLAGIGRNVSSAIKPLTNNPIVRSASSALGKLGRVANPVLTPADIAYNVDKVGKRSLGPIERTASAVASIPSPYRPAASLTSWGMEFIPGARKFDKQIIPQHAKAYKANPTGYAQMLGRSI